MIDNIQLDRIAFYGRTLTEYLKFFNLNLNELNAKSILDCNSGASSFVAEAHRKGINVIGCDPLYGHSVDYIIKQGYSDIDHVIEKVSPKINLFNWSFYKSLETLKEYRTNALKGLINDYVNGTMDNRYINAKLPVLPFADHSFNLVLSGHFLFVYSDRLDYDFHLRSILELLRVSKEEVRIYPLVGLDTNIYTHMDKLLSNLANKGIKVDIMPVDFEFQWGANQILCLNH
ncbi:MAG: class I SAM-dependent methyltransferase [Spirochaetota bacterium]|nr:class I SAM-dependent methyltransferase [Spirochaetota bacterium]